MASENAHLLITGMRRVPRRSAALIVAAATAVTLAAISGSGSPVLPERVVVVTGVAASHSSVRIDFDPVEDANDYRVYDIANPNEVKYAGLTGESSSMPVPATHVEWNLVGDGKTHTLVVEAVDLLGPVPFESLYDPDTNAPLFNVRSPGAMIGSNKGRTLDGKISTNGQGPYSNGPRVIARSEPFLVQADVTYRPIPSVPEAASTFLDTFDNSAAPTVTMVSSDSNAGTMRYTMNAGTPRAETIEYQHADVLNSMPFIAGDHFMDVLFDGGTPGSNLPLHQGHAVMALSPDVPARWSRGDVLHITQEVDAHTNSRRWMDILIVPADDRVLGFDEDNEPLNRSNRGIRVEIIQDGECTLDIYTAPAGGAQIPGGTAGGRFGSRLWGASGQAPFACEGMTSGEQGFDTKSRFDFFLTQTHAALFADGQLVQQSEIPVGSFGWAYQPVKIYYTHYVYHTDNDITELLLYRCGPMNSFWFNDPLRGTTPRQNSCGVSYPRGYGFPRSDERHWDNVGFEVLPGFVVSPHDFSRLSASVQPPAAQLVNGQSHPTKSRISEPKQRPPHP
jgi:hypothetical protein